MSQTTKIAKTTKALAQISTNCAGSLPTRAPTTSDTAAPAVSAHHLLPARILSIASFALAERHRWHKGRVFVSEVFRFEILGFEQVDEDFYKFYFRDVEIGGFDAEALRFRPVQFMR
jgi:hypothetical protein